MSITYKRNNDIVLRKTGNKVLMAFNQITGTLYELNETSGDVLELMSKQMSFDELLNNLTVSYQTSAEEIRSDVENLLKKLIELGLIVLTK